MVKHSPDKAESRVTEGEKVSAVCVCGAKIKSIIKSFNISITTLIFKDLL